MGLSIKDLPDLEVHTLTLSSDGLPRQVADNESGGYEDNLKGLLGFVGGRKGSGEKDEVEGFGYAGGAHGLSLPFSHGQHRTTVARPSPQAEAPEAPKILP